MLSVMVALTNIFTSPQYLTLLGWACYINKAPEVKPGKSQQALSALNHEKIIV